MGAFAGSLTLVGYPFNLSLFFARQPEPDLEFTEEELEQTTTTKPASAGKPPRKSGGGRPLFWILLIALIGGAAYMAMEPEQLTEWLASFTGDSTPQHPAPPTAMRPKAPVESTIPPPTPAAGETAGEPQSMPGAKPPGPVSPAAPPVAAPPIATSPLPPQTQISASPLFAEGQRVTVMGNPVAPGEMVQLTLDPQGAKPGPSVRPGTTLSILDGDLQPGGWVYSVRADDGLKGWVQEKRLRMKF